LETRRREDEPRRAAPRPLVPGADAPAAVHAQVAAHRDAAFEPKEHVVPYALDRFEDAAVDRARDAGRNASRVRRRRFDALSDEHLEPVGNAMERVTLWHLSRPP